MQALYLLALEPVAETIVDKNTYGFRPKRSCADAIEQCFCALSRKCSAQWVFEGDIKSCFNEISHQWLLDNIPMDKQMLKQWLKSGYIEQQQLQATVRDVAQGGIISPTLLNLTLIVMWYQNQFLVWWIKGYFRQSGSGHSGGIRTKARLGYVINISVQLNVTIGYLTLVLDHVKADINYYV